MSNHLAHAPGYYEFLPLGAQHGQWRLAEHRAAVEAADECREAGHQHHQRTIII